MTLTEKLFVAVSEPSLTTIESIALPDCPEAGTTVTVRLEPEPPKTMFSFGTKIGFDEEPVTKSVSGTVSISPTVNGIRLEKLSCAIEKPRDFLSARRR